MVSEFRSRRDLVVDYFRSSLPGLEFVEPLGAFYLFFRVDSCFGESIDGSVDFCQKLIAEEGVALVPGKAFGDDRWIRLSFAAAQEDIRAALHRIGRFIDALRGVGGDKQSTTAGP